MVATNRRRLEQSCMSLDRHHACFGGPMEAQTNTAGSYKGVSEGAVGRILCLSNAWKEAGLGNAWKEGGGATGRPVI